MPSTTTFNAVCYMARYPDLRASKQASKDPLGHYNKWGRLEGRAPGCDLPGTVYSNTFDASAYLARYPDIRQNEPYASDPLSHWEKFGHGENRHPGYEIIIPGQTPKLSDGFVSPGTVLVQDPNLVQSIANGIISNKDINSLLTDQTVDTSQNTALSQLHPVAAASPAPVVAPSSSLGTNSILYIVAGAGLLLIVLTKNKKKHGNKKRK